MIVDFRSNRAAGRDTREAIEESASFAFARSDDYLAALSRAAAGVRTGEGSSLRHPPGSPSSVASSSSCSDAYTTPVVCIYLAISGSGLSGLWPGIFKTPPRRCAMAGAAE